MSVDGNIVLRLYRHRHEQGSLWGNIFLIKIFRVQQERIEFFMFTNKNTFCINYNNIGYFEMKAQLGLKDNNLLWYFHDIKVLSS